MPVSKPAGVARIVYYEVLAGDRRKFDANSNDSDTGGGARDLRYNDAQFGPIFRLMFPDTETKDRLRDGLTTTVTAHVGRVWTAHDGQPDRHSDVTYEPPTSARPSEGRLTKVHEMPGLIQNLPDESDEKLFLLFVQQDDGKVYAYFATLSELARWNSAVYQPVNACAANAQGTNRRVVGWINFMSNRNYCHS